MKNKETKRPMKPWEKKLCKQLIPSTIWVFISTVAYGCISPDNFAYFWFALSVLFFCVYMIHYMYITILKNRNKEMLADAMEKVNQLCELCPYKGATEIEY